MPGNGPKDALFVAKSKGLNYWLASSGIKIDVQSKPSSGSTPAKGHVVGITFEGATLPLRPIGRGKRSEIIDFLSNSTSGTARNVGSFRETFTPNVYPGIGLRNYGQKGQVRYDFVVSPGQDPALIKLRFKGVDHVVSSGRTLTIPTSVGAISERDLRAYQIIKGTRKEVSVRFRQLEDTLIGFKVGAYDHKHELVIDPLVYGTYYGGDNGWDSIETVALDSENGTYLTGYTTATEFPVLYGPYSFNHSGGKDAYVSKLEGDVYNHVYSAFIGGSLDEEGQAIQVDPYGNVWIAGTTFSPDFPTNHRREVFILNCFNPELVSANADAQFDIEATGFGRVTLPWNATPQQVQDALVSLIGPHVTVSLIPNAHHRTLLAHEAQYKVVINDVLVPAVALDATHMKARMEVIYPSDDSDDLWAAQLLSAGTRATQGSFALTVKTKAGNTVKTAPIPYNASAATVQSAWRRRIKSREELRLFPDSPFAKIRRRTSASRHHRAETEDRSAVRHGMRCD